MTNFCFQNHVLMNWRRRLVNRGRVSLLYALFYIGSLYKTSTEIQSFFLFFFCSFKLTKHLLCLGNLEYSNMKNAIVTQPVFTCSKSIIETTEQCVKSVQS